MSSFEGRIRPALIHEAPAIRDLVRAAYATWIPVIGREPLPMRVDYDRAVREHEFFVAEQERALVGVIETMTRDDHLWIENVAVAPALQGAGLGRMLLAHAEERTRAAGLSELRLLTNEAFADNVSVYKHLGYVVTLREPYLDGFTLYMSKRLTR